jgi:thiol:disulfide interchange protein DsbG
MRISTTIVRTTLLSLGLVSLAAAPVCAASTTAAAVPAATNPAPAPVTAPAIVSNPASRAPDGFDVSTLPPIADALSGGGKAYYIGNRGGLDGWILVKQNQVQIAYMTADRKNLLIGMMFGTEGYDITADQVQELLRTNPQVKSEMTRMMQQQAGVGGDDGNLPPLPIPGLGAGRATPQQVAIGQPALESVKAAEDLTAGVPPGDRLMLDLENAAGVDIGDAHAPVLYMIMDPNCPHCQATWRLLRDAVFKKTLRIHLVPIGRNMDDERAAAQLLRAPDPLNAWDKYVGGDKSQLAGDADPKLNAGVRANHVLVDSWSISETPYMAYRSKAGEVKVISGEPDHVATLLSDVGP